MKICAEEMIFAVADDVKERMCSAASYQFIMTEMVTGYLILKRTK